MWKNHGKTLFLCFWWTQIFRPHVANCLQRRTGNGNLTKWALTNVNQVLYGHENRVSALKVSLRNSLNYIACFLSSYVCWRPHFSLEIEHLIQISKKVKDGERDFENCWCIAKRLCQAKFLNITFSPGSLPLLERCLRHSIHFHVIHPRMSPEWGNDPKMTTFGRNEIGLIPVIPCHSSHSEVIQNPEWLSNEEKRHFQVISEE